MPVQDHFSTACNRQHAVRATDAAQAARIADAMHRGSIDGVLAALGGLGVHSYRSHFGSLLHLAAAFGRGAVFGELLRLGLDVNEQSPDGSTPLHIAAKHGRHDIVEAILADARADDTLCDGDGCTASEVACSKQICNLLDYARNMHVLRTTKDMHSLVRQGRVDDLAALFQHPRNRRLLDINACDALGDSPLHVAARDNNVPLLALCLALGADPFAKNRRGKLPVELCRDDAPRAMLRDAPMVQPKEAPRPSPGRVRVEGTLCKWANYAEGYKRRWCVLEDGVLSYFRSQADYPVSCRGAVNVQFCRVLEHPTDRHRFEVVGLHHSLRLHLRADSVADAKRWVIAITETQQAIGGGGGGGGGDGGLNVQSLGKQSLGEQSLGKQSLDAQPPPSSPLRHASARPSASSLSNDCGLFRGLLEECCAGLSAAEATLQGLCDRLEEGVDGDAKDAVLAFAKQQAAFYSRQRRLHLSLQDLEVKRETEWLALKQQLEAMQEAIKEYAVEHSMCELRDGEQNGVEEGQNGIELFFDAMELGGGAGAQNVPCNVSCDSPCDATNAPPDTTNAPPDAKHASSPATTEDGYPIAPRQRLPSSSKDMPAVNLWSILKGLIGKDLFRFPLPISFCEPLSMLQRLAEDVEYSALLDKAAAETDPLRRIQHVAAFAVSCYSSTDGRLAKPFNPLLGETFELVDRRRQLRYLAEQVCHHPPISACHCEGRGWVFWSEVRVGNRFVGKSLDICPEGWNHVVFQDTGDHYVWRKVQMSIYNIVIGRLWIDHYGHMRIENKSNGGEVCELEFKPHGWRGSNAKRVVGGVYAGGCTVPAYAIDGHWNTLLVSTNMPVSADPSVDSLTTSPPVELWRRNRPPPDADTMYNFTHFAAGLNQLDPELQKQLCPTDSRFRPDQRAMEDGRWEDAGELKRQLEEKQRTTHKLLASQPDAVYKPRWFCHQDCGVTGDRQWTYVGGYWEARRAGDWAKVGIPQIFL